jgi:putative glutamine amidotransferase
MPRPLIGVTIQAHAGTPAIKRGRPLYYLDAHYADRVREAGGIPVLLPPGADEAAELAALDGLMLTGGEDIDPRYFHEAAIPELGEIDPRRDLQEVPLVTEAVRRGLPILGICRGMQVLNVAMGGTLHQDLAAQLPGAQNHRQETPPELDAHPVAIAPESRIARYAGSTDLAVNSHHHQALRDLAPGLVATAWAPDGVIEACESQDAWIVGVQWHPELQKREFTTALFRAFVEAALARRGVGAIAH